MTEPKQLTELADVVGKTVLAVAKNRFDCDLAVSFTDRTFIVLRVEADDYESYVEVESRQARPALLLDLKLIDDDEYEHRRQQEVSKRKAEEEANERAEFERLAAKFGALTQKGGTDD